MKPTRPHRPMHAADAAEASDVVNTHTRPFGSHVCPISAIPDTRVTRGLSVTNYFIAHVISDSD